MTVDLAARTATIGELKLSFEIDDYTRWRLLEGLDDIGLTLRDYGFDVVISSRFGDIFRGNSGKQGLLAAQVAYEDVERLWEAIEAEPGIPVTVDLVERTVSAGALTVPFDIDDYTRWRLLEGLDDIGLTLRDEESIAEFESHREAWRPKTLPIREPAESGSL
jgi:3-isopropylmalate/(R)-2-methylmalate dehydratase small subunit